MTRDSSHLNEKEALSADLEKALDEAPEKPRKPRGFAVMDPARRSEIASRGGKAAHAAGTAHQFTPEEAKVAGTKGGNAPHVRRGRGPKKEVTP